jgi:hypothetical protein
MFDSHTLSYVNDRLLGFCMNLMILADVSVLLGSKHHYRHQFDVDDIPSSLFLPLIFPVLPDLWKQYDTRSSIISRHHCVPALSRPSIAHSC